MPLKPRDIRKMEDEELGLEVDRTRKKLFELRTQAVTEKIHDTSQFLKVRRDVARLLTEQNKRRAKAEAAAR